MDTQGEAEDFIEDDEVLMENAVHCPACDKFTGHLIPVSYTHLTLPTKA